MDDVIALIARDRPGDPGQMERDRVESGHGKAKLLARMTHDARRPDGNVAGNDLPRL